MYKRIFAVLLLSLFLLVSCSLQPISVPSEPISTVPQNAASESETSETTKAPETEPADPSEPVQFDNRALNSGIVFLETEEKFFGMMRQEYIVEADPDTGECAYLCTKEGCDHMRLDCEARIGETEHGSLGFYEGKLYWIGTSRDLKAESVQAPKKGIWRIDPDGSGRELVRELETAYYYFQQAALYDGSYYLLVRNARPTLSGSVTGTWDLWRIPLGAGEAVRIFQMELDPDETWNSFRISSGALYFKTDINPADTQELSMKIVRISLPDGESEVLYEGKRPAVKGGRFLVGRYDGEGFLLYSCQTS